MEQEVKQEETVVEETSEVVSTEQTPTSEKQRTYTEEEWKTFQSKADKQIHESQSKASQIEHQLKTLEEDHTSSVKQLQELQQELDRKEEQGAEGDSEALSAIKLRRQARQAKSDVEKKERDIARRERDMASLLKEQYAYDLAKHYDIPVEALKGAESPEAMQVIALEEQVKLLGKRNATKDTPKDTLKYDKGISDVGMQGDEAFLRSYGEGKSDDHARATKLLKNIK